MTLLSTIVLFLLSFAAAKPLGEGAQLPLSRQEVQACRQLVARASFHEACQSDFRACQADYGRFYNFDGTRTDQAGPRFEADKFNILQRLINDYGVGGAVGVGVSWSLYPLIIRYLPLILQSLRFGGPAVVVAVEGAAWSITPAMIYLLGGSDCAKAKESQAQADMVACARRIGENIEEYFNEDVTKAVKQPQSFKAMLNDPQQSLRARFVCTALELRAREVEKVLQQSRCSGPNIILEGQTFWTHPHLPQVVRSHSLGAGIEVDTRSGEVWLTHGVTFERQNKLPQIPQWLFGQKANLTLQRLADLSIACRPGYSLEILSSQVDR